jgi:hypothetical protein
MAEEIPTVWEVDCSNPHIAVHREMTPEEAAGHAVVMAERSGFEILKQQRAERRQRALERLRKAAETSESAADLLVLLED